MSTTYSGSVALDILFNEVISSGLTSGPLPTRLQLALDLPNGTADGNINVAYAKREAGIGSAVTTVYDLIGSLTNKEGTVINFDEVVLIAVRNLSSTAANWLSIGPDVSNGFGAVASNKGFWADASDRSVVPADGGSWMVLYSVAGVPAAAGSTDEIAVITQSGTSANTWDILILGRDN